MEMSCNADSIVVRQQAKRSRRVCACVNTLGSATSAIPAKERRRVTQALDVSIIFRCLFSDSHGGSCLKVNTTPGRFNTTSRFCIKILRVKSREARNPTAATFVLSTAVIGFARSCGSLDVVVTLVVLSLLTDSATPG
jgi:hypothetical protein